jgi:hypothetical protein
MLLLKCTYLTKEQIDTIVYYDKYPTYADKFGIYFLNTHLPLPKSDNIKRLNMVINSSIVYFDNTVILIFNPNGKNNSLEIKENDKIRVVPINENDIFLKIDDIDFLNDIKNKLLNEDYNILGMIFNTNNPEQKELIFNVQFNKCNYIGITSNGTIKLVKVSYLKSDSFNFNDNVCIFEMKLGEKFIEKICISSEIHQYGECRKVFLDQKTKKIPNHFKFYFTILRGSGSKVEKFFMQCHCCEVTNNSKEIK